MEDVSHNKTKSIQMSLTKFCKQINIPNTFLLYVQITLLLLLEILKSVMKKNIKNVFMCKIILWKMLERKAL